MSGTAIPASEFINIIPAVLEPSAPPLQMNAVFVDEDPSIPIGTVQGFPTLASVQDWYGPTSPQAGFAEIYFAGYTNCTQLPGMLYFTQFNAAAVGAYLRGGSVAAMSLATLQGFSGTISIEIDGREVTTPDINLASATSFSNAAQLIQAGLQSSGAIFSGTATLVESTEVMTVVSTVSGELHIGDVVVDADGDIPAGTTVVSFGTYTPGTGTGTVNLSADATATVADAEAITVSSTATCTYDTLRTAFVISSATTGATSTIAYPTDDSLSPDLLLLQDDGAVLSQGAAAATPAGVMNAVVAQTQNWATFMTTFEPAVDVKLAFAEWLQGQNNGFAYIAWDSDAGPTTSDDDPDCFAQQVAAAEYSGVVCVWDPTGDTAAFGCSIAASINFAATAGRTNFAYRSQTGLLPQVTDPTIWANLKANGYNAYINVATRSQQLKWFQSGVISGPWDWIDSYINQIYWNSVFQNDFAELLSNVGAIPYTQLGYEMLANALSSDIQAMGNFGAWVKGVTLSASQQTEINSAAGLTIAPTLQSQGWYLQISDPGPTVRAARGSPDCTFWYTDGGSVQQINMSSVDVE